MTLQPMHQPVHPPAPLTRRQPVHPPVHQAPDPVDVLQRHLQINENHSPPVERLGAFMRHYGIPEAPVTGQIETPIQAIQYMKQKMLSGEHWHSVNKWSARFAAAVLAAGLAVPVGVATAGLGTAAAALLAGAVASGGTAFGQDFLQSKLHKFAVTHDLKLNPLRGVKALYKKARGTKGEHRRQAAQVLVDAAGVYLQGGALAERSRDYFLAYQALVVVYGDGATVSGVFQRNETRQIRLMVEELLRS